MLGLVQPNLLPLSSLTPKILKYLLLKVDFTPPTPSSYRASYAYAGRLCLEEAYYKNKIKYARRDFIIYSLHQVLRWSYKEGETFVAGA
jgi:hypothetical protein